MGIAEENYKLGRDAAEQWIKAGGALTGIDNVCAYRTEAFANGFYDRIYEERNMKEGT